MALFTSFLLIVPSLAYIREGPLYELTDNDYSSFLEEFKSELRVVLHYLPFSGSGKSMTSDYFQASKELTNLPIKMSKIDMSNGKNLKTREKLKNQSFPYIIYCLAHTDICRNYTQEITRATMINSFTDKIHNFINFYDIEDYNKYIEEKNQFNGLILGIFEKFEGKKFDLFQNYAKTVMDKYKFALLKDEGEWTYKFDLKSDSIVVAKGKLLNHSLTSNYFVLNKFTSNEDISKFVNETYHPFLSFVDQETLKNLKNPIIPFGYFFIDINVYKDKIPYFVDKFIVNSQKYLSAPWDERKYQWAVADTKEFKPFLQTLSLQNEELFMLLEYKGDYYKISQESIYENNEFKDNCLEDFYNKFEVQKYPKYHKTDPVPKINYEKGVRVAVGSNFEEIIENKDRIHAVFVYDSSTIQTHKSKLESLESLAENYKTNYKIEFVKIDAKNNYVPPRYEISSIPKLFFAIKKKMVPHEFEGIWDIKRITEKIEKLLEPKNDL
ncbi:hypothetical protein SteCoe_24688 [Stentor coeruleus]|uniref:Thioredoxin domain-containing protein n=1 Tax=Stentor coeruleus TaxID=5963 RepID=A0A1R2BH28_9CILI|nr:hypothetical protein SteCoe_24688 [Stentor coeruleus]